MVTAPLFQDSAINTIETPVNIGKYGPLGAFDICSRLKGDRPVLARVTAGHKRQQADAE